MNRRLVSWRVGALAALVVVVVAVVGTGVGESAFSARTAASATTLVDGTTDTVTNIDPAGEYDYGSATLDYNIFQGLYEYAPGAKLTPTLATGCKASSNQRNWTCTLRKGVRFSDGSSFDSSDVKFTFDRVSNPTIVKQAAGNSPSSLFSNLKSTTTAGPYKVVFHLKTAQSTWPLILTTSPGLIVSKTAYKPNAIQSNTAPQLGTGPYMLAKYTPGQQAVFQANPNYWGSKPKTSNVIVNYYTKSSTMKLALQKGEIDMAYINFTPQEYASLAKAKGIRVYSGNGITIRYLVFNVKRAPVNNPAVRQAIAYLMPRQAIATRVYHGLVKPLYSQVPAGLLGHIDAFALKYGRTPNVAKAKAVLQSAGVATPIPLTIWYTPTHYGDASADEYAEIQRALNASGLFNVTLKTEEWAQYVGTLGRTLNAFQLGWYPDYVDAEDYTLPFFASDSFLAIGYNSPAMNLLITKERTARTLSARLAAIRGMQLLQAKDVPTIPYWQGKMLVVGRSNVRGIPLTMDAAVLMRFWLISKS
jgi:peptide/nickel transport system substrate-binding protein